MVAMQMTDEYMADFGKADARAPKLYLCPLPTINHKLFTTNFHHLRRGKVAHGWQCTTATKYMYSEWLQNNI